MPNANFTRKTSLSARQWLELAVTGVAFGCAFAAPAQAQTLTRLAAEFDYQDGETSTTNTPPEIAIYNRTVTVPGGIMFSMLPFPRQVTATRAPRTASRQLAMECSSTALATVLATAWLGGPTQATRHLH